MIYYCIHFIDGTDVYLDGQSLTGDSQSLWYSAGQLVLQNLDITVHTADGHYDLHAQVCCVQLQMLQGKQFEEHLKTHDFHP